MSRLPRSAISTTSADAVLLVPSQFLPTQMLTGRTHRAPIEPRVLVDGTPVQPPLKGPDHRANARRALHHGLVMPCSPLNIRRFVCGLTSVTQVSMLSSGRTQATPTWQNLNEASI